MNKGRENCSSPCRLKTKCPVGRGRRGSTKALKGAHEENIADDSFSLFLLGDINHDVMMVCVG